MLLDQDRMHIRWTLMDRHQIRDELIRLYKDSNIGFRQHIHYLDEAQKVLSIEKRRPSSSVQADKDFQKGTILGLIETEQKKITEDKDKELLRILNTPITHPDAEVVEDVPKEIKIEHLDRLMAQEAIVSLDKYIKLRIEKLFVELDINKRVDVIITNFEAKLSKEVLAFNQLAEDLLPVNERPKINNTSAIVKRKVAIYGINNSQRQLILLKFKDTDLDFTFFYSEQCNKSSTIPHGNFEKVFTYCSWMNHAKLAQIRNLYPSKTVVQINGGMWSIYKAIATGMNIELKENGN